jgi:hypothetical protein
MVCLIYFIELVKKQDLYKEWMTNIKTFNEELSNNLIQKLESISLDLKVQNDKYYQKIIDVSILLLNSEKS